MGDLDPEAARHYQTALAPASGYRGPSGRDAGVPWAARAERLWAKGMTLTEVGAALGVSKQGVHQVLFAVEKKRRAGEVAAR